MILSPFLYICDLVCSLFVPGLSSTLLQTVNNHIHVYTVLEGLHMVSIQKSKLDQGKNLGLNHFCFGGVWICPNMGTPTFQLLCHVFSSPFFCGQKIHGLYPYLYWFQLYFFNTVQLQTRVATTHGEWRPHSIGDQTIPISQGRQIVTPITQVS